LYCKQKQSKMKVLVNSNSLTIRVNDSNAITTIAKSNGIEFFQSVEKGNKVALELQNKIKDIVTNRLDKKNNYQRRLKIVADAVSQANTQTFRGVLNVLNSKF